MNNFDVVASPIQPHMLSLINHCSGSLTITSPYIKKSAAEWLAKVRPASLRKLIVLTNVSITSILSKSLETTALRLFFDTFPETSIVSLPSLHAKVFIADEEMALITSANFTNGGLWNNYEYGIIIRDRFVIHNIIQDMNSYMAIGSNVSLELLKVVEEKIAELATSEEQIESNSTTQALRQEIKNSQSELQNVLFSTRLRQGQTINALFSDTILLILRKHPQGLPTQQLHIEVQKIHPDICDDSIDRVVNGQHFGKRWKHYVRRAQEHLKDKNLIVRLDKVWVLNGQTQA